MARIIAARITIDHGEIRDWIEEQAGRPGMVKETEDGTHEPHLIVLFGGRKKGAEDLPWERFFKMFEADNLAFVFQYISADGEESRMCTFVDRTEHQDELENEGVFRSVDVLKDNTVEDDVETAVVEEDDEEEPGDENEDDESEEK